MGTRNPMNSWSKSDSARGCEYAGKCVECTIEPNYCGERPKYIIGPADHDLLLRLARAGSVDGKFRRMIVVYVDITAPLYWWKEFDTYKVGTVANSCSTMHKIHAKEFTHEDFSTEHLDDFCIGDLCIHNFQETLDITIRDLNKARELYLETKTKISGGK